MFLQSCVMSRQITITSEPARPETWFANQPIGLTPATIRVSSTGGLPQTFDPEYVTVKVRGYDRAVRPIDYEWSIANIVLSLPLLGAPVIWWGKVPFFKGT